MIKAIQSLRGVFALLIFEHHYTINRLPMIDAGNISVVFFIMLSGAMLPLGYGEKAVDGRLDMKQFMRNRLARLYPVYFLTLLCGVILFDVNHSLSAIPAIICDAFMVQGWIPSADFYFSGNPPGWCMADFLFFYLLFPFIYPRLASRPQRFFIILLAIILLYFSLTPLLPESLIEPLTYISPLFRSLDFVLGLLIGYLFVRMPFRFRHSSGKATLLETIAVIIAGLFYYFQGFSQPLYNNASWWWLPVGILIIVFGSRPFGEGAWSRMLSCKWLVDFGAASYSFFLTGYLCIMSVKLLLIHFTRDEDIINRPACMLIALAVAIPVGLLTYRYVELPLARLLSARKS